MSSEVVLLVAIMIALTLYAVFGGADFGAGVWEFITALQSPKKEQKLIYGSIGPVWEANHVWLIFVLIAMFGAFPTVFAAACRALWVPLLLALAGIVFRGVGFVFHSYAAGAVRQQAAWGAVFAFASTASPFFLGACIGAVASGRLDITPQGQYTGDHLTGWISPLAIFNAFFAVAICAYLAAVFLARDAFRGGDAGLIEIWRTRALASGVWLGILAFAGLAVIATDALELWAGFRVRAWPLVLLSVLTGLTSLGALWRKKYSAAVLAAGATVTVVLWGWAFAQYPALIPPHLTIQNTKSPDKVLLYMIWTMIAGTVLIVPSLALLFYLFKSQRTGK